MNNSPTTTWVVLLRSCVTIHHLRKADLELSSSSRHMLSPWVSCTGDPQEPSSRTKPWPAAFIANKPGRRTILLLPADSAVLLILFRSLTSLNIISTLRGANYHAATKHHNTIPEQALITPGDPGLAFSCTSMFLVIADTKPALCGMSA